MTKLLEVRDLVKRYREVTAVDGISFNIHEGTCFGLLGPNGAGKTTTVEMLEGVYLPTQGSISYQGEPLGATFREEAGIMFQRTALQDYISVQETLQLFSRLYSTPANTDELIHQYALAEFLKRDVSKLSGGLRQRLLLAIAMINNPTILFLDEPTTGLDPQARRNFWQLLEDIKKRGKTIILTTHYMEEAYALCDEIIIMAHGKIIAQGTPGRLLSDHYQDVVLVLPAEDFPATPPTMCNTILRLNDTVEILTDNVNATLVDLLGLGISLHRLQIRTRTLEDLFLELTGSALRV